MMQTDSHPPTFYLQHPPPIVASDVRVGYSTKTDVSKPREQTQRAQEQGKPTHPDVQRY
jgi:hypothetical protein